MLPTIRLVVITAIRDRLLPSLLIFLALTFGISAYLGSAAVAEAGPMALVYAAGGVRLVMVLGLTVFVAFHLERLYETREIEGILSRAIARETFVISYWLGMSAVMAMVLVPVVATLFLFGPSKLGAAIWSASVLFEVLIVVAFVIFCAASMERAIPSIFATMGFYALARSTGFFLSLAEHGKQGGLNQIANPIVETIGHLVPRLDLMGQTQWLVYGAQEGGRIPLLAVQSVVYVVLLLGATTFDLRRKHF
jgi:hypothetical protein